MVHNNRLSDCKKVYTRHLNSTDEVVNHFKSLQKNNLQTQQLMIYPTCVIFSGIKTDQNLHGRETNFRTGGALALDLKIPPG